MTEISTQPAKFSVFLKYAQPIPFDEIALDLVTLGGVTARVYGSGS